MLMQPKHNLHCPLPHRVLWLSSHGVSWLIMPSMQECLEAVVLRVPPPKNNVNKPLRALIFDSYYDAYRGVVCQFRVMDGSVSLSFF